MTEHSDTFFRALKHTLGIEQGYVDHPDDPGGKTNWGITEAVARAYGYDGDMRDLPVEVATAIYHEWFWSHRRLPLERVAEWHEPAALELFDTAVNMHPRIAATFFQEALNVLNRNETLYPDLKVDGWAGTSTMAAMNLLTDPKSKSSVVVICDCLQGARYVEILKADPRKESFTRGWFLKRIGRIEAA